MKLVNKLTMLLALLYTATSCSTDEPDAFNTEDSYIYFNMPFVYSTFNEKTDVRYDSLKYSFAFEDYTIKNYVFNVPIGVIGVSHEKDREFKVEVVKEKSTVTSHDWDESSLQNAIVKKGEVFTDFKIKINRTETLKSGNKYLVLRIHNNENFGEGDKGLLEVKLVFSDILNEPIWWKGYLRYFGPFQKEIYFKLREIYPLGSDNTLSYENKKPLYWDNIPSFYRASWYPVLALKINVLKQYFIENMVYPDGDTSKPRILLPN